MEIRNLLLKKSVLTDSNGINILEVEPFDEMDILNANGQPPTTFYYIVKTNKNMKESPSLEELTDGLYIYASRKQSTTTATNELKGLIQ